MITSQVLIMSEKCLIYRSLKHEKRLKSDLVLESNFLLIEES